MTEKDKEKEAAMVAGGNARVDGVNIRDFPKENSQDWLQGWLLMNDAFLLGRVVKTPEGVILDGVSYGAVKS